MHQCKFGWTRTARRLAVDSYSYSYTWKQSTCITDHRWTMDNDHGTTTIPGRRNNEAAVVKDGGCCGLWPPRILYNNPAVNPAATGIRDTNGADPLVHIIMGMPHGQVPEILQIHRSLSTSSFACPLDRLPPRSPPPPPRPPHPHTPPPPALVAATSFSSSSSPPSLPTAPPWCTRVLSEVRSRPWPWSTGETCLACPWWPPSSLRPPFSAASSGHGAPPH